MFLEGGSLLPGLSLLAAFAKGCGVLRGLALRITLRALRVLLRSTVSAHPCAPARHTRSASAKEARNKN